MLISDFVNSILGSVFGFVNGILGAVTQLLTGIFGGEISITIT